MLRGLRHKMIILVLYDSYSFGLPVIQKYSIKMSQLPADCLNDIFEYLEEDKITLHSCLLVNRLWCEISTRILWKIIRNYNTLISCLPNESKEFLSKNGIIISKFPTFNYASFCK